MDLSFFSDFVDPEKIGLLSFGEKMMGSTMVTILGMGITFVGLIFIMYLLSFSSILIRRIEKKLAGEPAQVIDQSNHIKTNKEANQVAPLMMATDDVDSETVAAIMAALTVMMQTSTSNIVITNIKRISSEWNKAGKADQFASRF